MDCITNEEYQKVLKACRNGTPCRYGLCDECPNVLGTYEDDIVEEFPEGEFECPCCGTIVPEGRDSCPHCLVTVRKVF